MSPTFSMMCHVTLDNLCEIYLFIQRNPNLKGGMTSCKLAI